LPASRDVEIKLGFYNQEVTWTEAMDTTEPDELSRLLASADNMASSDTITEDPLLPWCYARSQTPSATPEIRPSSPI
jgi:hypothetical protein